MRTKLAPLFLALFSAFSLPAAPALTVHADRPGAPINPAMWGIFFEDINLGADGGLYAELVKNRSFEFTNHMMGWSKGTSEDGGAVDALDENPFSPANPHYLRIISTSDTGMGVSNEGFRGMGIREGESYDFSTQARSKFPNLRLKVELVGAEGKVLAT